MRSAVLARACAVLLACLLAPTAVAQDIAGEAFAAGRRAFERGEWADALASFEAARDAGMDGPAVHYNIGVCQYRLGDYARAERSFRELAARHPAMAPLADYNRGLALYRQRETEQAAAAFERAAAADDPKIAQLAARMLDYLEPPPAAAVAPAAPSWTGFVDLSLGADDNVALVDDASLPAGESTDSPFAAVFGQLTRSANAAGFGGSAGAYLIRYPDAGRFDQDILELAGSWRGAWRDWRLTAGPHVSFSTFDGEAFERRLGASLTLAWPLDHSTSVTARAAFEEVEELAGRFAFVDGSRRLLELELDRGVGQGRVTVEYAYSVDDRASASVSPVRHRVTAAWRQRLGARFSLFAAASFRASRYDDLAEPRDEDRRELALTLARDLPRGWQATLDYRHTRNASNIDAFDYSRNRLGLGVNRLFQ